MAKHTDTIIYILAAFIILFILFKMVNERGTSAVSAERVTDVVYVTPDEHTHRTHLVPPRIYPESHYFPGFGPHPGPPGPQGPPGPPGPDNAATLPFFPKARIGQNR